MSEEKSGREACSVTQAMDIAKRGLEQIHLRVMGEISEFSDKPGYKAIYFSIRDDRCTMPCLMWRNVYAASGLELRQGALVELTGKFSCYPEKGRMQFSVTKVEIAGEGRLRMQVAQLAEKLRVEGLMDPARKRRITLYPERIAVVTSPRGKAIRDVVRTLRRRYPLGELLVFGVPVEGNAAVQSMCDALVSAQQVVPAPDVILLVRGGGSYEDYMPFNDERLARAVAGSTIPVVTGIGHEPDNSIADMVADLRCSTPTAAAEAVAISVDELASKVSNATKALNASFSGCVANFERSLSSLEDRALWKDPNYLFAGYAQTLDLAQDRLGRALPASIREDSAKLDLLEVRLKSAIPNALASQQRELATAGERLRRAMPLVMAQHAAAVENAERALLRVGPRLTQNAQRQMALAAAQLDALSPLKTLSRGYSIAYAGEGPGIIKSVEGVESGDQVSIRVEDGSLRCTVDSIERGNHARS